MEGGPLGEWRGVHWVNGGGPLGEWRGVHWENIAANRRHRNAPNHTPSSDHSTAQELLSRNTSQHVWRCVTLLVVCTDSAIMFNVSCPLVFHYNRLPRKQ